MQRTANRHSLAWFVPFLLVAAGCERTTSPSKQYESLRTSFSESSTPSLDRFKSALRFDCYFVAPRGKDKGTKIIFGNSLNYKFKEDAEGNLSVRAVFSKPDHAPFQVAKVGSYKLRDGQLVSRSSYLSQFAVVDHDPYYEVIEFLRTSESGDLFIEGTIPGNANQERRTSIAKEGRKVLYYGRCQPEN